MSIAAMKQALEALDSDNPDIQLRAAVALRTAIEQAEKQEPVGHFIENFGEHGRWQQCKHEAEYTTPLYRHAAPRQPLTQDALQHEYRKGFIDGQIDMRNRLREPLEWLTGCPECGADSGCDCDEGTWNPPAAQRQPLTEDDAPELTPSFFANATLTRPGENLLAQQEPWGWLVPPYGDIQRNPKLKVTLPPAALAWRIPLYMGEKE